MTHEEMATKIVKNAVAYINRNQDQRFGAAQVALISLSVLVKQAVDAGDTDAVNWNRILLKEIERAAL